jgi:tRNA nucleotidyltransferase/poly(A) polymerase
VQDPIHREQRWANTHERQDPLVERVFDIASASDTTVYLVGGTVRDLLLKVDTHDLDFSVDGNALALSRRVADALGGAYVNLDPERRTGRVILPAPQDRETSASRAVRHLDMASLRGESLTADLRDRDFTVNAAALVRTEDKTWQVFDPLGGLKDLHEGVLRAATPSSFVDDPVRTLRAIRLHLQLDFVIEPQTWQWLQTAVPLLRYVSAERIRDEWFKILMLPGTARALRMLHETGLLQHLAPPMSLLGGRQLGAPLRVDALTHSFQVVEALEQLWEAFHKRDARSQTIISDELYTLAPQILQRYRSPICDGRTFLALIKCAAFLHNVGVAGAQTVASNERICHVGYEQAGAEIAGQLGRRWRCSNAERALLGAVVGAHGQPAWLAAQTGITRRGIYRYFRETGPYGVDAALVSLADHIAVHGPTVPSVAWERLSETVYRLLEAFFRHSETVISPRPLLSGHDVIELLGLSPGPRVGEALAHLAEEQAAGEIETRDEAVSSVRRWLYQGRRT